MKKQLQENKMIKRRKHEQRLSDHRSSDRKEDLKDHLQYEEINVLELFQQNFKVRVLIHISRTPSKCMGSTRT